MARFPLDKAAGKLAPIGTVHPEVRMALLHASEYAAAGDETSARCAVECLLMALRAADEETPQEAAEAVS